MWCAKNEGPKYMDYPGSLIHGMGTQKKKSVQEKQI